MLGNLIMMGRVLVQLLLLTNLSLYSVHLTLESTLVNTGQFVVCYERDTSAGFHTHTHKCMQAQTRAPQCIACSPYGLLFKDQPFVGFLYESRNKVIIFPLCLCLCLNKVKDWEGCSINKISLFDFSIQCLSREEGGNKRQILMVTFRHSFKMVNARVKVWDRVKQLV